MLYSCHDVSVPLFLVLIFETHIKEDISMNTVENLQMGTQKSISTDTRHVSYLSIRTRNIMVFQPFSCD